MKKGTDLNHLNEIALSTGGIFLDLISLELSAEQIDDPWLRREKGDTPLESSPLYDYPQPDLQ